jgi:pSer/pThr/pTyr-binding forkhead associated (FHA) protein
VVNDGDRFCGHCGGVLSKGPAGPVETLFFEAAPSTARARLVLVRGPGGDGSTYLLNATEHVAGREAGDIVFPEDDGASPTHAVFTYHDDRLYVKDLGSLNGTYLRIRQPIPLKDGDAFMCGDELLVFSLYKPVRSETSEPGTRFCGTPLRPWRFQLRQLLDGGRDGIVFSTRKKALTVGREGCDVNFPTDRFISGRHARVEERDDGYFLVDLDSRNGTFYRLSPHVEVGLREGDYLFIGHELLRVEAD